jgi:putative PIN family toxin of toxin-antitoxin system
MGYSHHYLKNHGIICNTMNNIVIDTNVFIAAMTSSRGASHLLLKLIGTGRFDVNLSVPLMLEYEDVAKRLIGTKIMLSIQQVDDVIDYLCSVAQHHQVYYLWRPTLKAPGDDMLLELAVTANCQAILTDNIADFAGIERFGVVAITPKMFLEQLGVLS